MDIDIIQDLTTLTTIPKSNFINISNRIIKRKNDFYQHHKRRSNQMNSSLFFAVSLIE